MLVWMMLVLPALLASASSMCISVQSASQWSRQMCRNRACVRETRFSSDSSATVCSHSFQPLNQSVRIPTWSRNIMASVFSVGGGARGRAGLVLTGGRGYRRCSGPLRDAPKSPHMVLERGGRRPGTGQCSGLRGQRSRADTNADVTRASSRAHGRRQLHTEHTHVKQSTQTLIHPSFCVRLSQSCT